MQIAVWLLFAGAAQSAFAQSAASGEVAPPASGSGQALPADNVNAAAQPDSPMHLRTPMAVGARSQLDTPFSTTVVTGEELADRQANKLGEVFAGDSSVTDNSNAYSEWATYISIRGLPIDWQNGFRIDGNPFVSYGITMPYENLDRVDMTLRAAIDNMPNRRYWMFQCPDDIAPGDPRRVSVNAKIDF